MLQCCNNHFLLLLFLSLCLLSIHCQFDVQSIHIRKQNETRQTIYLHIGPHKTGTTAVQSFVHINRRRLKDANLCWPNEKKGKSFSELAKYIANPSDIVDLPAVKDLIHRAEKCLQENKNVFISAERFSLYNYEETEKVKALLLKISKNKEVKIKIILTYREWFSWSISRYGELLKKRGKVENANNFLDYMFYSGETFQTYYRELMETWARVFGLGNIFVIDYYGIQADKADIIEVIFCEIMHAFCGELHKFQQPPYTNEQLNPIYINYIFVFDNFLFAHGMKQCSLDLKHQEYYLNYLTSKQIKFPTLLSTLEIFRSERIRLNAEMYKNFSQLMLHANQSANEVAISTHVYHKLDTKELFQETKWQNFMQDEMNRLISDGKICNLSHD